MSFRSTDSLHLGLDLLIIIADDISGRVSKVLTETFYLRDNEQAQIVSGKHDAHLRMIEAALNVRIVPRGLELAISGDTTEVSKAAWVLRNLASLGPDLTGHDVHYAIKLAETGDRTTLQEISGETVVTTHRGKQIRPKTTGQRRYISAIAENDIVFGIGPAGTGKTYLAMAAAIAALKRKEVSASFSPGPRWRPGTSGVLLGICRTKLTLTSGRFTMPSLMC